LREFGSRITAYQLQGHLIFVSTEPVVREVMENFASTDFLVLDLKRVLSINESACRLLYQILERFSHAGKSLIFTHAEGLPLLRRYMKARLGARCQEIFRVFEDNDLTLEWCENRLLAETLIARKPAEPVELENYELFQGFSPEELAVMRPLLKRRAFRRGEVIIEVGDEANELYFLAQGTVSVLVTLAGGARKRLATFSPGMAFGEMAILDRAPRSALIQADSDVECDLLDLAGLKLLGESHPAIKIKILENLSLGLCRKLRKANREISVLE